MTEPITPTGKRLLAEAPEDFIVTVITRIEAEAGSLHHTQTGCEWCATIAETARQQERERIKKMAVCPDGDQCIEDHVYLGFHDYPFGGS